MKKNSFSGRKSAGRSFARNNGGRNKNFEDSTESFDNEVDYRSFDFEEDDDFEDEEEEFFYEEPLPQQPVSAKGWRPDSIKTMKVEESSRLIDFLISRLPEVKRTRIKQFLAHSQVAVNGVPQKSAVFQLEPGMEVAVNFTREFKVFRHRRLKIVYEDDDIIVVHKGYGLLSMGNENFRVGKDEHGAIKETAYSILRDWQKSLDPRNKVFIVHRLDRDTSGLMLFAKSVEAKETLQHNWNQMVLNRTYLAVVEGVPEQEVGVVRSYLKENSSYEVFSTDNPDKDAKLAVTRYRTIGSNGRYSLLEVELDTGRKNQIRVHMHDLGTPIAGDHRYGGSSSPLHRLALHAKTLRFVHPVTRKEMNFSTPIPTGFSRMVR